MSAEERRIGVGDLSGPTDAETLRAEFERAERIAQQATNVERFSRLGSNKRGKVRLTGTDEELSMSTLKARDRRQDIGLKRLLAYFAIAAVAIQLGIADWFFYSYLSRVDFIPSDAVMIAWLSSTVVEIIGIVAIIARNLFPNRATKRAPRSKAVDTTD